MVGSPLLDGRIVTGGIPVSNFPQIYNTGITAGGASFILMGHETGISFEACEATTSTSNLIKGEEITAPKEAAVLPYKLSENAKASHIEAAPTLQVFESFAFDETVSAIFYGRCETRLRKALYITSGLASLGFIFLLARWLPNFRAWLSTKPCSLKSASHILVVNSFKQSELVEMKKLGMPPNLAKKIIKDPLIANTVDISTFDYRCNRFIQTHQTFGYFESLDSLSFRCFPDSEEDYFLGQSTHWTEDLRLVFGLNEILLEQKSAFSVFVDQVLNPFYVFQVASFAIWIFENYYLYAFIILLMATGSAIITVFETKRNMDKLRQMARHVCPVKLMRDGAIIGPVSSSVLVPGDVIILDDHLDILPCDAFLISGDAILDESMLTGETVPVSKTSMPIEDYARHFSDEFRDPKFAIYSGTKILRCRPHHGRPCMALVTRTGFLTTKGNLVQAILFPRPNKFRFYQDSMMFIAILGTIAAVGFLASLVNFLSLGMDLHWILTRALDIITVVVPPALPATMAVGTVFAMGRLERNQIFCISPPRINIASEVRMMCFDKTGTLTEEGLEILGVMTTSTTPTPTSNEPLTPLVLRVEDVPCLYFIELMATCHGVKKIGGKLLGDSLDLRMFSFSKWNIDELPDVGEAIVPTIVRPSGSPTFDPLLTDGDMSPFEIGIIRQFPFDANLRRMSVIVRSLTEEGLIIFAKGSPESIQQICTPNSLPENYSSIFADYARQGYRVIGCAMKKLQSLSWIKAQKLTRQDVESDLVFLGFIIFENRLKEASLETINVLKEAKINNIMATGDNILTAISVGRACGIVGDNTSVFYPISFSEALNSRNIEWLCVDNPELMFDAARLKPYQDRPFTLAITGDFYDWIRENLSEEYCNTVIKRSTIYARMSPQQKQSLVECVQAKSMTIGFCGDGANDCGALKAADVGISLSQAEASIAAPFTSKIQDISCVPVILKEGRASLVTSFCCFKYMTLYSMIQFTTLIFLYSMGSSLSDGQFVWIDLCLIVPLGILMSRYSPAEKLAAKSPPVSLVSVPVLLSILGHIALQAISQALFYFFLARPSNAGWINNEDNTRNPVTTMMFLFSSFFYIYVAAIFSVGRPFRQAIYPPFLLYLAFALVLTGCITFFNKEWLQNMLLLVDLGFSKRLDAFILSLCYGGVAFLFEKFIVRLLLGQCNKIER